MKATRLKIRVKKEDAAFLYAILESYEGLTTYSTLEHPAGAGYRDLQLMVSPDFIEDVKNLLAELGDKVYVLKDPES